MKRFLTVSIVAALACSAEKPDVPPQQTHQAARPSVHAIESIDAPSGPGAAEPFVSATKAAVLLSWVEPVASSDRMAVRVAQFDGVAWSAPQTIVERSDVSANWANFPSVVEDANGTRYAQWLQKIAGGGYAADVWMSIAPANGAWGAPFLLNGDHRKVEHGFSTLAALPHGGVAVAWLDGRNMNEMAHEGAPDAGDMSIRYAEIDAAGKVSGETELDARTCECCTTGMAIATGGAVVVYRDRSAEDIRDIAVARHTAAGWSQPKRVHEDDWKLDGCPVNGPQADAIGDDVAVAWFTGAAGAQHAFAAVSHDGGSTFGAPVRIDETAAVGRVDVAMLAKDDALVSWVEQARAGAELRMRHVVNGIAQPSTKVADVPDVRAAGFPRIARVGGYVYFTWTEQGGKTKSVKVARVRM